MPSIIIITDWFPPSTLISGVKETVFHTANALVDEGCHVTVVCSDADAGARLRPRDFQPLERDKLRILPYRHLASKKIGFTTDIPKLLNGSVDACDFLLLNDVLAPACVAAGHIAVRKERPYILAPRGVLMPRALRYSRWRKAAWLRLYGNTLIGNAGAVLAASDSEANMFRQAYGRRVPAYVVSNGCTAPQDIDHARARSALEQRWPMLAGRRLVLFLGRLSREKGLDTLLDAWSIVKAGTPDAFLIIAGNGTADDIAFVSNGIVQRRHENNAAFVGPVHGADKWQLFFGADLFVLPSHTENFGHAALEALTAGTPVVATRGTPWQALDEQRCGRWVEGNAQGVAAGILDLLALPPERLRDMGAKGRAYAQSRFSWQTTARGIIDIGQTLTNAGHIHVVGRPSGRLPHDGAWRPEGRPTGG